MQYILIALILSLCTSYADQIEMPSPCDEALEKKTEKENKICESKKQKSQKAWASLDEAKKAIMKSFAENNPSALLPYVGCDSFVFLRYEFHCLSQQHPPTSEDLKTLVKKVTENKYSLDAIEWINFGVKKDLYLLCSKAYKTKVTQNYCENKDYQPIIAVSKNPGGYSILGIAITEP